MVSEEKTLKRTTLTLRRERKDDGGIWYSIRKEGAGGESMSEMFLASGEDAADRLAVEYYAVVNDEYRFSPLSDLHSISIEITTEQEARK